MGEQPVAAALTRLRAALADVRLPVPLPGRDDTAALVRAHVAQLDDYILPRLAREDAPLLAVISGSTGAGKSTLVNSLVGRVVSAAGVIRPTTLAPVLVHNPRDGAWFASDSILPSMARSPIPVPDARTLQLVPDDAVPDDLAFLDAPDVDSVVAQNRALAAQLMAAADLWLFVTTAARYADAVPWGFLKDACDRRAVVAVVLDRVPVAALDEVPQDLRAMMDERGLAASKLFVIPEIELEADGLLPAYATDEFRAWLAALAQDAAARSRVVAQTLGGAIDALIRGMPVVISAVRDQVACLDRLRDDAESVYRDAVCTVDEQTANGVLMRGEVLARWQDFVGTGDFFRAVEQRVGWLRDRLTGLLHGEPAQVGEVKVAVETGLEVLINEAGESAARRVAGAWEQDPAGRELLRQAPERLDRASASFRERATQAIRTWQSDVLGLVTERGAAKRTQARVLALGVNAVGVALMILVFSQTGGLLGAEIGVAGGTAVLAQRLLEAVFGEEAVRQLAKQAKRDLDARVEGLLSQELARYLDLLAAVDVRPEDQLVAAVAEVETARFGSDIEEDADA